MPKSRRRPNRTRVERLARRKRRPAERRGRQTAVKAPGHPVILMQAPAVAALPLEAAGLPVVALPAFIDAARRMLTALQVEALKRHVLEELGDVRYEHCAMGRHREVKFEGFKVLVHDDWVAGEIQLVGLKPLTDGDDPNTLARKLRLAIRRALRKGGTIVGYEMVKRLLREWLGYQSPCTFATQKAGIATMVRCINFRWDAERLASLADKEHSLLVLDEKQNLDAMETWYVRTRHQSMARHLLKRGTFAFDSLVEEASFIGDLRNEHCSLERQVFRESPLRTDISHQRH